MFYFTGDNYLSTSPAGLYDQTDTVEINATTLTIPAPPDPNFKKVNFASLQINESGGNINLNGLSSSAPGYRSDWNNQLFFFRRRINADQSGGSASISGGGSGLNLVGKFYGKWMSFSMTGGGSYQAQIIAGSLSTAGQTQISVPTGAVSTGYATQVFLVE